VGNWERILKTAHIESSEKNVEVLLSLSGWLEDPWAVRIDPDIRYTCGMS
jgi:hypothetical protein